MKDLLGVYFVLYLTLLAVDVRHFMQKKYGRLISSGIGYVGAIRLILGDCNLFSDAIETVLFSFHIIIMGALILSKN